MQLTKYEKFTYFYNNYLNLLKEPTCIPPCLTEVCGGWYQETFKQVMNKFSKNKSAPFPLYFSSIESMESICQKRGALKQLFGVMDIKNLKRIDATQVYAIMLFIAKADYESVLKCLVDIFGVEQAGFISKGQLFFFIDSLFRGLAKILITKKENKPSKPNVRIESAQLNTTINKIMGSSQKLSKTQICDALEKASDLNNFLKYIHLRLTSSSEWARQQSIRNMKIEMQVKAVIRDFYQEIEKRLKAQN